MKIFRTAIAMTIAMLMTLSTFHSLASWPTAEYLPEHEYDQSIPKPEDVLGYPVGTWHVRHDQLVNYMKAVAEASDRATLEVIGYTHEQRPLMHLTFTSAKHRNDIDGIQARRLNGLNKGEQAKSDDPIVLYMGYSVHGNESSGSNTALLVAYYLAASKDPEVTELLDNTVIIIDPAMNPDGLSRFAQWANMHKGYNLVADPVHREHREHWPSGRTNHYWFDLNRDWLLLTHPESKARIAQFQKWRPHILTDFHEMGTNSTYFFQPGIPSRKNPLTPDINVTVTNELGKYHAEYLDAVGELYFTEQSFDDFYYGKGSTYPDAQGSVGILFEQASSRGHLQESINGLVEFPRTIKNQVITSLSTFAGALANKSAIQAYQNQFYRQTRQLIEDDDVFGYVLQEGKDKTRFARMLSILDAHKIEYRGLDRDVEFDNVTYQAGKSVFIPTSQPQYRLLKSLFSSRKSFADNTFYDVSNWNIAMAFNLNYSEVSTSNRRKVKSTEYMTMSASYSAEINDNTVALAFEWFDYQSPALTNELLKHDVQLRVAGQGFTAKTTTGTHAFAPGSMIMPKGLNKDGQLDKALEIIAKYPNVQVHSLISGLTPEGIDLGSPSMRPVEKPEVLLVGGRGTSQYEIGEIWHYLDTRVNVPATLIDLDDLGRVLLDRYTHIIFASGRYGQVSDSTVKSLDEWVKAGGVLFAQRTAVPFVVENKWIENELLSRESIDAKFPTDGLSYADRQKLNASKLVAGAAFESKIDLTHPLFFGYEDDTLPLFKTYNMILQRTEDPFEEVAIYSESPLLGGFAAEQMQELVSNTSAIVVNSVGRGVVIASVDNLHFRGYWDGTNKLMANTLFMSPLM